MNGSARLRLRPFAATRYNPASVGDIGQVTSPPYDMMDRRMIEALLDQHPQNIVRLVLPRLVSEPVHTDDPYRRAAKLLERWRAQQVLVTDPEPALYVYEYGDESSTLCGVVGALELRHRDTGVVLPHEDVIPEIVADRLAMMTASDANLEPILLVYDGAGGVSEVLARARSRRPQIDITAGDSTWHRIWPLTDRADIRRVNEALARRQALIADGHHRYASYLRLQQDRHRTGRGDGPWDFGLAMLIDQSEYPLRLSAIHRSISELRLDSLSAPDGFVIGPHESVDPDSPRRPAQPGELLVVADKRLVPIHLVGDRDLSVSDAELLHERLLPAWRVEDHRLGYHHTVQQAVHCAEQDAGVAVLLHESSVSEVMDVARAGKMMPRKSTSFGPKPRTGLVMRHLDTGGA